MSNRVFYPSFRTETSFFKLKKREEPCEEGYPYINHHTPRTKDFFTYKDESSIPYLENFLKSRNFDWTELKVDKNGDYLIALQLRKNLKIPERKGLVWVRHKTDMEAVQIIVDSHLIK